jgi:hypothetical protein
MPRVATYGIMARSSAGDGTADSGVVMPPILPGRQESADPFRSRPRRGRILRLILAPHQINLAYGGS